MATRTFGEQLRTWRTDARLSQRQLAAVLGVKQQSVGAWENDVALPEIKRAGDLEQALRLPPQTVMHALYAAHSEGDPGVDVGVAEDAALSGKLARLSPEDRSYIDGLVDRLLGK